MLLSTDFRAMARDALRGKWRSAALVSLLAGLLGANIFGNSSVSSGSSFGTEAQTFFQSSLWLNYRIFFIIGGGVLVLYFLVLLVIGGAATLGYARYNLNLVDHQDARVDDLFSQFHRLGQGFCMQFFRWLFAFLWALLFIIPGIIAEYSYAMTPYILLENPEMTAREAIAASKELMKGNKFRLFCLELSFIGWSFLCSLPFLFFASISGIAAIFHAAVPFSLLSAAGFVVSAVCMFFLNAYTQAAAAAFYREICREKAPAQEPIQPEENHFEVYQLPYTQVD